MINYVKMLYCDKTIYFSDIILTNSNPIKIKIEENEFNSFDGFVVDMKTLESKHITRTTTLKGVKDICKAYVSSEYGLIKTKKIRTKRFINS